jgi:hypothetical protein
MSAVIRLQLLDVLLTKLLLTLEVAFSRAVCASHELSLSLHLLLWP